MIRNTTKLQKFGWVLFLMYLIALTYFMFFAESFGRTPNTQSGYAYNLELFKEIKRFYTYREQLGFKAVFLNLVGNVVGFMPFGFFLPFVTEKLNSKNVFAMAAAVPIIVELFQLILGRSFDIDDLICNFLGIIIGFFIAVGIKAIRRTTSK